jgi:hypothetical protein
MLHPRVFLVKNFHDVVSEYDDIVFGLQSSKQKFPSFGLTHNWVKRSIFWELPYWKTNLLIPLAFRDLLPKGIWDALTEISHFFRDICSSKLNVDHIERLKTNIIETLCKLEMIFPPSFFDSMEHLPVHLPFEAKVGGPVQYRWMYPFKRLDITVAM